MKKIILFAAVVAAFAIVGCGGPSEASNKEMNADHSKPGDSMEGLSQGETAPKPGGGGNSQAGQAQLQTGA